MAGGQSESKLRFALKMGRWTKEFQRNDMKEWDLTVTCEWFDFRSEMFLALIDLLMVCNVSVYLLIIPSKRFILLENVELDFPAKLYRR